MEGLDEIPQKYGIDKNNFTEKEYHLKICCIKMIENEFLGEEYIKSNFTKDSYNRFDADDMISGNIENGECIEMADISVRYTVSRGHGTSTTILFEGAFVSIEYKNIYSANFEIIEKSEIVNSEVFSEYYNKFDKYYRINFEDSESTSKILTEELKQFIADFREKYKIRFEISIKQDKIYIRFFTGDMWKANLSKEPIDKMSIYKFYVITKFAKELVEKLDNM